MKNYEWFVEKYDKTTGELWVRWNFRTREGARELKRCLEEGDFFDNIFDVEYKIKKYQLVEVK